MEKVQPKHPLSIRILKSKIMKYMDKPPKLGDYDGKGDPGKHVQLINDLLIYFSVDNASSMLTLVESA